MTAAARGRANRRKGHDAERSVARWLRTVGFPHAERAVVTGWSTQDRSRPDPGDVTGIPGVVISVKAAQVERHPVWRAELAAMLAGAEGTPVGLIVCRRSGKSDPGHWWVWLTVADLVWMGTEGTSEQPDLSGWVCMPLGDLAPLLRRAGYGQPADAGEAS